jgi:hypothetical protein
MFELLIVLALLMFAVGLLLPLVQLIRLQQARMQSMNNLKQMGLALHNCQDTFKKLPPAIGFFPANKVPDKFMEATPAPHGTIFYHVLPFLEQANVYNSTTGMSRNSKNVIPTYLAPADATAPANGVQPPDNQGAICYGANGYVLGGGTYDKATGKAYFGEMTLIKISQLDGTSNTIAFGERFATCEAAGPDGKETTFTHAWSEDGKGRSPFSPVVWKHDLLPQFGAAMKADPNNPKGKKGCNPEAFQAFSPGGIQVALFDGSVRTVSPKISQQTWSNAIRHDDGQPLGNDW